MVTREDVIKLMTAYIKEQSKKVKSVVSLPITLDNWGTRHQGKWHWSRSVVHVGDSKYEFVDKEINDDIFVNMLNTALKLSGVRGKVFYEIIGSGYYSERRYKKIEIFAKPCKEFLQLNKLLVKLGCKALDDLEVYRVSVCGKRSAWSDSGRVQYLMHDAKSCQHIMDCIKTNKVRGGVVRCVSAEWFSHGDDVDYNYAQYAETEWYGCRGVKLMLSYNTSKGVERNKDEFYCGYYG